MSDEVFDALVIGAGFGGLGAALTLAEAGGRVCLCETLRYPGGCASTFSRDGYRFDAGATLVSGLGPGQLFGDWIARHDLEVELEWMDPLLELRAPGLELTVRRDRGALLEDLCQAPGAPAEALRAFFAEQRRVADLLWSLFDDPSFLPPLSPGSLLRHAARAHRYAPLLPLLGRPLAKVLSAHGLDGFEPLRIYLDALCQITVQCSASEAEAPFALAAMDYYHRGTAHIVGGVGALAEALFSASARLGVDARLSTKVRALRREPDGTWVASTRRGDVRARAVIANLVPSALSAMVAPDLELPRSSARLGERVDAGWGAVMLYLVARAPEGARPEAHHLELVADTGRPFSEGNHVFASISSARESERAPAGRRAITVSTHVPMSKLSGEGAEGAANTIATIQARMRATLRELAPEWTRGIEHELPASPRTFARFVGRPGGAVGGIPRRAGLANYRDLGPHEAFPRLWLVGDSVFPGQSALATAIGGGRTALALARAAGTTALRLAPARAAERALTDRAAR